MPLTKRELLDGRRDLIDEVGMSGLGSNPDHSGRYGVLLDGLNSAIRRVYGERFLSLSGYSALDPEVEAAYNALIAVRQSPGLRGPSVSGRLKRVPV